MSPYLFLLCVDGLSTLISKVVSKNELKGVSVVKGGTKITHFLFVDDCIIFGRANWVEWLKICGILELYERASGESLNKQKTTLFFSPNVRLEVKNIIVQGMGARVQSDCEKYLDLPVMVDISKYNSFIEIKDKIW